MNEHVRNADAVPTALDQVLRMLHPLNLSYCDYIAERIGDALKITDNELLLKKIGRVQWDLHPEHGYMLSTKKTIEVTDRNGTKYRITIERCDELPRTPDTDSTFTDEEHPHEVRT